MLCSKSTTPLQMTLLYLSHAPTASGPPIMLPHLETSSLTQPVIWICTTLPMPAGQST